MPRVVIGLPLYNGGEHFAEALETLAGQTYDSFGIVVVDDCSGDDSPEVARRLAESDDRVEYQRNDRRLGLTSNWRRAAEIALRRHPDAEYFAWGSDHDVWHPRWLEALVGAMDENPEATMAYPLAGRIEPDGRTKLRKSPMGTLADLPLRDTLDLLSRQLRAGYVIYGLIRVSDLRGAGIFHDVLYADRLAITQLALRGSLVEVDEWLWYKRRTGTFSLERQLRSSFPDGVPPHLRLPWWLTHVGILTWWVGVEGGGGRRTPRRAALSAAALYAWFAASRPLVERLRARRRSR